MAALNSGFQNHHQDSVLLTARLASYWEATGNLKEGAHWLPIAIKNCSQKLRETQATLHLKQLSILNMQGDFKQLEKQKTITLKLCQQLKDPSFEAEYCNLVGLAEADQRNYDVAEQILQKGLNLAEIAQDDHLKSYLLLNLGHLASYQSKTKDAFKHYDTSLKLATQHGDQRLKMIILTNLASIYIDQENYHKAIELSSEALELATVVNDKRFLGTIKGNMGYSKWNIGEKQLGADLYKEHLMLFYEQGIMLFFVCNLFEMAYFWVELGLTHEGLWLWGAAEFWRKHYDYPEFHGYSQLEKCVLESVEEPDKSTLLTEGAGQSLQEVVLKLRQVSLMPLNYESIA